MANLCLDSSSIASGTIILGTAQGVPNDIRDDNLATAYGDSISTTGATITISYTAGVTWSTYSVASSASVVHFITGTRYSGLSGAWTMLLSSGGSYVQVGSGSLPPVGGTTHSVSGSWSNVSGVRFVCSAQCNNVDTSPPTVLFAHGVEELQCFGNFIYAPIVITITATDIDKTLATFVGSISNTGNASCSTRGFDWGTDTSYGNVLIESGTYGVAQYSLLNTALQPVINYHFRAKAVNVAGTGYGSNIQFVTVGMDEEVKKMSRLVYDKMMDYMMEDY